MNDAVYRQQLFSRTGHVESGLPRPLANLVLPTLSRNGVFRAG